MTRFKWRKLVPELVVSPDLLSGYQKSIVKILTVAVLVYVRYTRRGTDVTCVNLSEKLTGAIALIP
ncbi:hypothetical protein FM036_17040 [Nostoc sp. HG1]|nr:hypothetical protein [Nostoc sp. HG1]